MSLPTAAGQLRVARLTDRLQVAAARHVEALRGLAAGYWRYMRHPGWTLAPDALVRLGMIHEQLKVCKRLADKKHEAQEHCCAAR